MPVPKFELEYKQEKRVECEKYDLSSLINPLQVEVWTGSANLMIEQLQMGSYTGYGGSRRNVR